MCEIKHHVLKELCFGQAKFLLLEHATFSRLCLYSCLFFFFFLDDKEWQNWLQPWEDNCLKLSSLQK